jgi:hypothetical protein
MSYNESTIGNFVSMVKPVKNRVEQENNFRILMDERFLHNVFLYFDED